MTAKLLLVFGSCIALSAEKVSLQSTHAPSSKTETISIRVSEGTMLAFDVSADGTSIVFDLLGQLWLLPATGGEARAITDAVRDTAEDLDPSFSPDAKRVVFRAERDGRTGLWLLDLDTKKIRQLTQLSNPESFEGSAAWSPDARAITFTRLLIPNTPRTRPTVSVAQLDVASGAVRELHVEGLPSPNMRELTWSRDGKRLALIAGQSNGRGRRVWIAAADSLRATPLTPESLQPRSPILSPDGRTVAFLAPDSTDRFQVWTQEIGGAATRLTNHNDVAATRVRWSSDGKTIIYSAEGKLWRISASGGTPSNIPFTAQLTITRPRRSLPQARFPESGKVQQAHAFMGLALSPDASTIAAIALSKMWMIPIGGVARVLTEVPHTARHLAWSPDESLSMRNKAVVWSRKQTRGTCSARLRWPRRSALSTLKHGRFAAGTLTRG